MCEKMCNKCKLEAQVGAVLLDKLLRIINSELDRIGESFIRCSIEDFLGTDILTKVNNYLKKVKPELAVWVDEEG